MKKHYQAKTLFKTMTVLCTLSLFSVTQTFAQVDTTTIPNHSFETWACPSYCNPVSWFSDNAFTYLGGLGPQEVTKVTGGAHVHSGNYSVKLTTQSIIGNIAPGTLTNGIIDENSQAVYDGSPISYRPFKFRGWYQFAPSGSDTFVVSLALYAGNTYNTQPIGTASFITTSTVSAWTQFDLPINYTSGATPDTVQIVISSGTGNNSQSGTIAYVDDLSLIDCRNMAVSATPTNTTCALANGNVVAVASGGISNYSYAWSNNGTTATISNLAANSYTVVATDAEGCTASATASIAASTAPAVALTPTAASCTSSTGSVVAAASSGTSPYTYAWSNSTTGSSITNVAAANYSVVVTDSHSCTVSAAATVTSNNVPFTVTPTNGTTSCASNTGTVSVLPTAGNSPYSYLWTNGNTTSALSSLGAGSYAVTVTDAHGCTTASSATVTTPNGPSATDVATNLRCHGDNSGSIVVTETGGTGNLTYAWSNSSTAVSLHNVAAGSYSLTITDANNCSFAVSATLTEPVALTGNGLVTAVTCFGGTDGSFNVTPAGGTLPYTYSYAGGATPGAAGSYTLIITDANACKDSIPFVITQPAAISLTSSTLTNVNCFGGSTGSITVTPGGGAGGTFAYNWSPNVSTTDMAASLPAGSYSVTATDGNSCTGSASFTVTQPASAVTANVTTAPASSATTADGSATVAASGGTGTFSYQWSNGGSAATITNLTPATYCVTVNDTHDCTVSGCDSVAFSVGINELNAAQIKVYPNPATDQLTIETGLVDGKFQLNIYSLDGKLVDQKAITGDKSIVLLNQLTDGLYTYQLKETLSGGVKYGKLQIQR